MAGRPPKPTRLLELKGTARRCRMERRGREPRSAESLPAAPEWLLPEAKAEWVRVSRGYAAAGVLTLLDRGMLATYCQMWARFVEAEQAVPYAPLPASFIATMASIANKLGLDPSGRVKLGAAPRDEAPRSPWDALAVIQGGRDAG